ncbi:hypothetical protein AQPE_1634 [Aquipluma nitroreducens]|uniref:RES domain-containing protein n=1 Tax=Aquipluma nitroreducens TaxID=2010828 RepID=A0A5K7S836_9BACT|nr:RES family NAD+ phosphorylase [Aquipluma nitroreducens]BBE17484.1 hypothetical protein AQPE_1634 [Aquipluma nitroreducens]
MNQSTIRTLNYLKGIKKSAYPIVEILDQIKTLNDNGYISGTLPVETEIVRARLHDDNESFYSKSQLTYVPNQLNTKYKRASTPNNTMFYGTLSNPQPARYSDLRDIPLIECHPWLRDKTTKGYRKVTFGRWKLLKEIRFVAIVQHDNFKSVNPTIKYLSDVFNKMLTENREDTIEITNFFASEFAKEETTNDYDYLISAILSEEYLKAGIDGIIYPSVRSNGEVFNVAITAEVADKYMTLVQVTECSVYKYFENCWMDNDFNTLLYANQTNFTLEPLEYPEHIGTEYCLKQLGLSSLDELK